MCSKNIGLFLVVVGRSLLPHLLPAAIRIPAPFSILNKCQASEPALVGSPVTRATRVGCGQIESGGPFAPRLTKLHTPPGLSPG